MVNGVSVERPFAIKGIHIQLENEENIILRSNSLAVVQYLFEQNFMK